jgi:uncharacterized membrane protein
MRLPPLERLAFSVEFPRSQWSTYSPREKIVAVTLAALFIFGAAAVVSVIVTPRPVERFTEFYMLNATGVAGSYPTNLTANQTGTVTLTVHNAEYTDVAYEIRVYQATMEVFFNASANRTQYRELSRAYVTNFSFDLYNGGYWNRSYSFSIPMPGIYRLYFHLYKLPDTGVIYRHASLPVYVRR